MIPFRSSRERGISVLNHVKPLGKSGAFELIRSGLRNIKRL